jgi:hypothetical protein
MSGKFKIDVILGRQRDQLLAKSVVGAGPNSVNIHEHGKRVLDSGNTPKLKLMFSYIHFV